MLSQSSDFTRLKRLRDNIDCMVPDLASTPKQVYESLGWDQDFSEHYTVCRSHGVDLRCVAAPVYAEVISMFVNGDLRFPYPPKSFHVDDVLDGSVPYFVGRTPKERLLAVVDSALWNCGH